MEGLRKPKELILIVVALLAYGCPRQAIVHAFDLDERTVTRWQDRAGKHCQKVHEDQVMQAKLDLVHVQVDEIRVKGCQKVPWMALAIMVSTRLWLGGVVSLTRDRRLADRMLLMVKACCLPLRSLLVLTDGWAAYPKSIRRAFRSKVKRGAGRGRSQLHAWPDLLIGTVIKRTEKKLACLTRRCRHAARRIDLLEAGMWLVGCTYNLCWPHHELSRRAAKVQGRKGEVSITPAMASGLTDHVWSIGDVLLFRIAPPEWIAPKRRGRSRKAIAPVIRPLSTRPRPALRLRKGALCPTTR